MCRSEDNPCARALPTGNHPSVCTAVILLGALTASCGDVELDATSRVAEDPGNPPIANRFSDSFDDLDPALWACEGSCPTASDGRLTFSLLPGVEPDNAGTWSKIRFVPRAFNSGSFTVNFALGPRPTEPVFWGVALWNEGPSADQSQYHEINFGCATDGNSTNAQLHLLSARLGEQISLTVDAGVDLYDGAFHTGRLEYDSTRVDFYLDDVLLGTIDDPSVIPTEPLSLILGTRLVTTPVLASRFDHYVDSCEIEW